VELFKDEVPGDVVWAVVSRHGDYPRAVDWFLTAEASSEEYRELVGWMRQHGGLAERWQVSLPRRRMEQTDVTLFIEEQVLSEAPTNARKLDTFSRLTEEEEED
jgi:hypothetical protein